MSGSSFRSVFMVASCAGAALGCYLVSLRVASERAALEEIETEIVMAQRDIRLLQTEIGTRGRLAQLERWNVKVLALSAPAADQFLEGGFALARLARPAQPDALEAPVVLAAAPADAPKPTVRGLPGKGSGADDRGVAARDLLRVASFKTEPRPSSSMTINLTNQSGPPKPGMATRSSAAPSKKLASADPTPKSVRSARPARPADPLAPLPAPAKAAKESGKTQ
ncbi:MAG TPA: hypothetical protein VFK50_02275 [Sphingomicrobium sp.]|nr:hypothetical protein [Sphingomicrobium sp.]